jgi:hypothetical protein
VLPPSSERLNLLSVVYGMTGRRECIHYVAVLGTIQPESAVDVAIRYGLDGSRIESLRRRDIPHPSRPVLWPIQLHTQMAPGPSEGESGRGVALTTYPL